MQLNGITYCERSNRPVVLSRVGLEAHFLSDGEYTDPYEISAVSIFLKDNILYPNSILDSQTQVISESASSLVLMNFCNINGGNTITRTNDSSFNLTTNNYTTYPARIYRSSVGKYIVFLDGTQNLAGSANLFQPYTPIVNSTSATGDYIDVWTFKMYAGSDYQTAINNFSLRRGGFTVLTEPLMITAKSRLVNNKVTLGSKVDLKIATDIHVENTTIDESVKNLFRDTVLTSGCIEIQKLNDATNVPARVTVSSFSQTSATVGITSDNVMVFNWDTSKLSTHPDLIAGNFGSIQGVYAIRAKYNLFNEIYVTDPMFLTLS